MNFAVRERLSELKGRYEGVPGLVLGGGPSLVGDVNAAIEWWRNCDQRFENISRPGLGMTVTLPILIGVNHHAIQVGMRPDYVVFWDDLSMGGFETRPYMNLIDESGAVRVSPHEGVSDVVVDLDRDEMWVGSGSGCWGAWFGCWLGCDPVILCGMDLYQGERLFCHGLDQPDNPMWHVSLEVQVWNWGRAKGRCEGWERIRAVSGPLTGIFPILD